MGKKICHICNGTGIYIDRSVHNNANVTLLINSHTAFNKCFTCDGTGFLKDRLWKKNIST